MYAFYSEAITETWFASRCFLNFSIVYWKISIWISINFIVYGFSTVRFSAWSKSTDWSVYLVCVLQLAPYVHWTCNNQVVFILQMNFPLTSVLDIPIDDSKPKFQSLRKIHVHHETYKRFWDYFSPTEQKFHLSEQIVFISISTSITLRSETFRTYPIGWLRNSDGLKQNHLLTQKTSVIDLWSIQRNASFLLILRLLIQHSN